MIATETATRFNREPSKILGQAERGDTVIIEKHGEPCAVLIPHPRRTSGAEMARRLGRLKPSPQAADTVENLIKGMDDASRRSFGPD
jgi:prevent-host-death family protein